MARRKSTGRSGAKRASTNRRSTWPARRTASGRTSTGVLYPRRRRSRPGLPTTVGTALGTLVVTTLLDQPWPVRLGLIAVVLVVGLGYVLWRHRSEIAAAGDAGAAPPDGGSAGAPATGPPEER